MMDKRQKVNLRQHEIKMDPIWQGSLLTLFYIKNMQRKFFMIYYCPTFLLIKYCFIKKYIKIWNKNGLGTVFHFNLTFKCALIFPKKY